VKKIFTYLLLTLFLACTREKQPQGVLSEDKMVEILTDIHLAEGIVSSFPIHFDSSRVLYPYLENEVFEKHAISDSVFRASLEYYMRDLRVMDRIYARTIDSLHVIESSGK
jgi:hypothetical protein